MLAAARRILLTIAVLVLLAALAVAIAYVLPLAGAPAG